MMVEGDPWRPTGSWGIDLRILHPSKVDEILEELQERPCRCGHKKYEPRKIQLSPTQHIHLCPLHALEQAADIYRIAKEKHKQQQQAVETMLAEAMADKEGFGWYVDRLKETARKLRRRTTLKYKRPKGRHKYGS